MATKLNIKGNVVALAQQLIAGTNKHLANTAQVMLVGGSFTPAQVTEKLQALVKLRNDVDAAKASTKARLAVEKTDMPALRVFMDAFVSFVKAGFGTAPDVLADFGLHPKARTPLTAEAKTAAAAKRKATRAARHTTGAKKKKSVKGAVTGIIVTPITSEQPVVTTAPSSPSAPATSTGTTAATTPHTGT
ncbi:MAG: hypothetical protein M3O46_11365 [Myxococcota bacterium]|nr:hypothetical protein [Myxococcota bacterium]